MSIKYGLLSLLSEGPKYGYQLRAEFDRTTGGSWPLNVGQVYTTLQRLESSQLVEDLGEDDKGRSVFGITEAGRDELTNWFATPVDRESRSRDELAIKLAMAVTVPGVDVRAVLQRQRNGTLTTLQELTKLKRGTDPDSDLSWMLVLDSMIFAAEAEVRWIDHCEARLVRHRRRGPVLDRAEASVEEDASVSEGPQR